MICCMLALSILSGLLFRGVRIMYRLSAFNKVWQISDNQHLLYNSISDATIQLTNQMLDRIENNKWETFKKNTLEFMLNSYILLPESITEEDIYNFNNANIIANKNRLGVFIVPSRKCNLSCTYCMQNNLFDNKENLEITKEVIDGYYEWLKAKISQWEPKKLDIIFYGGEPLTTNITTLNYLLNRFNCLPINPNYRIITNGVNLMKYHEIFDKVKKFQITIDGRKEIHDTRRIFKDGKGSFDIIIKNILDYLALDNENSIIIRFNVDKDNRNSLLEDIKSITSMLPMKKIDININPVDPYGEGITDRDIHSDIKLTAKAICDCQEYLSLKFNIKPHIWRINCGITSLCQWSFDTDGSIYKCPALTGDPERAVTSIFQTNFNDNFYKTVNRHIDNKCKTCCYLGICGGGCPRQEEFIHGIACKREFFDSYIPRIIEIKHGITGKSIQKDKNIHG